MDSLDILAPHFRSAQKRWPAAPTLSNHYKALAECYEGSAHSLIATIKSFIECVCLTILGEFGRAMPSADPSTTDLLVEALKLLGLQNSKGASKLGKLLSAHNKLANALTELRNESDPIAHGKDGFIDALTANERRAFLITADTILALVLSAYDGTEPDLQYTREPYDRFVHLHERVDRAVTVEPTVEEDEDRQTLVVTLRSSGLREGVKLRVEPSRLLYAIDRTAYVEVLATSAIDAASGIVAPGVADAVARPSELRRAPEPVPVAAEFIVKYDGMLFKLRSALEKYLKSLSITIAQPHSEGSLVDSLLAAAEPHVGLDWTKREPLQAAMKVALRRTLLRFGIGREMADEAAEHLVSWLKIQAADLPTMIEN